MSELECKKAHRCFGGAVEVFEHTSAACGGLPMTFAVFTPPQAAAAPVPVLYFLSGLTCTWENVMAKSGIQRAAARLGLMVVAPDTSPRGAGLPGEDDDWDFGTGAGFYLDATEAPWSEHYRMERYVVEELPALVAGLAGADVKRAGITGHSMGGHGALTLGLRHPERYRSISALAPICSPTRVPWGQKAFSRYLGQDRATWRVHDATALVRERTRTGVRLLVDQGAADPFLERELKPELLEAACDDAGQPLELRMHEGYDHSYYFVSTFIADHVAHHARALKAPGAGAPAETQP